MRIQKAKKQQIELDVHGSDGRDEVDGDEDEDDDADADAGRV